MKQNIASLAFVEFIKNYCGENSIEVLPNGGKNALYCNNGRVSSFADVKDVHKTAKTIDFIMHDNRGRNIYISHKRTDGNGGAQANQLKDAESFLLQSEANSNINEIFIAVLDGNYYHDKLEGLKMRFEKENKMYVCNSDILVGSILKKLNKSIDEIIIALLK